MANLITVTELAKELGVSKQLIYYHSKKISKDFQIRNQSNQLVFNEEQVNIIKGFITKTEDTDSNEDSNLESHSNKQNSKVFKTNLKEEESMEFEFSNDSLKVMLEAKDDQIKILKDVLNKKDERIDTLLNQLSYSQRLIDQQQQLDQYRSKFYLANENIHEKMESKNNKWWEFWK